MIKSDEREKERQREATMGIKASKKANISKHFEDIEADSANIDLTVELNREQRGQVTAIRYPTTKKIETIPSPIVCDDKNVVSFDGFRSDLVYCNE
ncbi:hypothetical protein DICVIV_10139 [Dictyocaulus viviparus]|uniref:Uncharacterized protein n=1 Tax=Dictyocaulus viviparus TaxID=29172 RepID=A0A0D8XGY2_DICVI|nr:hypothetical protein DICVIV_10139 [Dictyocaulus viviparus]